jgi:ferredoxin
MPHIVTSRCVNCRYTDCCQVCPVDCFWEIEEPAMLVIDPDTCIDCGLCIEECPVKAIYTEDDCPEPYTEWIEKNASLFEDGTNVTDTKEPLPDALTLQQIHEREASEGLDISDP